MTFLVDGRPVRYDLVPNAQMMAEVLAYIEHGAVPGPFLKAIVSNDLVATVTNADTMNCYLIYEWCRWLFNYAPRDSFGSPQNYQSWLGIYRSSSRD